MLVLKPVIRAKHLSELFPFHEQNQRFQALPLPLGTSSTPDFQHARSTRNGTCFGLKDPSFCPAHRTDRTFGADLNPVRTAQHGKTPNPNNIQRFSATVTGDRGPGSRRRSSSRFTRNPCSRNKLHKQAAAIYSTVFMVAITT